MEYYRTLDLTLLSTNGPKRARNLNVYAVASMSNSRRVQKYKTPIHKDGGYDPVWNFNFPMKFTVNETAGLKNRQFLDIKIKSPGLFVDKNLGQVRVPMKVLLEATVQMLSYPVRGRNGDPKGVLTFSFKFGEKTVGASSVNRPRVVCGAGGYSSSANGLLISDIAYGAASCIII